MSNIFSTTYSGALSNQITTSMLNATAIGGNVWTGTTTTVTGTGTYTISGGMTGTNVYTFPSLDLKTCRTCDHAHIAGQKGCIISQGLGIEFVTCLCVEYLPKDNLEYIEHMYDKQKKNS